MEVLKKLFPFSFAEKNGIGGLIVNILLYLVVGAIAGVAIALLAAIPVIGLIIGLLGGLIDLYVLVGIIISILDYCKVLK